MFFHEISNSFDALPESDGRGHRVPMLDDRFFVSILSSNKWKVYMDVDLYTANPFL